MYVYSIIPIYSTVYTVYGIAKIWQVHHTVYYCTSRLDTIMYVYYIYYSIISTVHYNTVELVFYGIVLNKLK